MKYMNSFPVIPKIMFLSFYLLVFLIFAFGCNQIYQDKRLGIESQEVKQVNDSTAESKEEKKVALAMDEDWNIQLIPIVNN